MLLLRKSFCFPWIYKRVRQPRAKATLQCFLTASAGPSIYFTVIPPGTGGITSEVRRRLPVSFRTASVRGDTLHHPELPPSPAQLSLHNARQQLAPPGRVSNARAAARRRPCCEQLREKRQAVGPFFPCLQLSIVSVSSIPNFNEVSKGSS